MIVDPTSSHTSMAKDNNSFDENTQQPPSYDAVVNGGRDISGPYNPEGAAKANDVKVPAFPHPSSGYPIAGPPPRQGEQLPATTVYNYVNPVTGERVVSLLPPDHPQMICLQQGGHVTGSKFGLLGILAAVFWFPLGVGLCLLDRKVYCKRCGVILDEGMC